MWAVAALLYVFAFANFPDARGVLLSPPLLVPDGTGLVIADVWLYNRADNYLG